MKHKHAEVLIAIAEGKEVEWETRDGKWIEMTPGMNPLTHPEYPWKIKSEPEAEWKQRLRQAAREGKEVQKKCGNAWLNLNQNYEAWALLGKQSDYRIVPKTVTRWLWAYKQTGTNWFQSRVYLTDAEAIEWFDEGDKIIKLDYTAQEFEE